MCAIVGSKPSGPISWGLLLGLVFGLIGFSPSAALGEENVNSPAISGELFDFTRPELGHLICKSALVKQATNSKSLQVDFGNDTAYPNIEFPCPKGGWNLSAFGGVQLEVSNIGTTSVKAGLRVDNPGNPADEPFNVEINSIAPGETKTLHVVFGKANGNPGYPLDSKHVTAIQFLAYKPTAPSTLLCTNLKAIGSPAESKEGFSSPADRKVPVTPPNWLGQRPPVDGDWVQTLNSDFKATSLDDKIWGTRLSWTGTLPDWTHRFSKENLIFEDGVLKIKCERRTGHAYDDPALLSRDYTTAMITTLGKWSQCYGYIEARIKPPTARGLWACFWTMPDHGVDAGKDRESTYNGAMEFDILEHLTEWGPGRYNAALHWDGYGKDHKTWASNQNYYGPTPDGWHNWGVLWEPGKVTWYCDGIKKAEFSGRRVASVPGYLILDVQMGGWATKNVDEAHLPDYMQIDYVRAWQLRDRLKP